MLRKFKTTKEAEQTLNFGEHYILDISDIPRTLIDELSKMNVKQLSEYANSLGIAATAKNKKADILEKILIKLNQ